ncbi:uncharacterized protein VTP21DRAFT_8490 [Calcarisporiella thermophila]|uniref:uncharacterized protein n=1 Tax=Calcarisporiella thermophila TaxID=911321 RepID=UPI003744061C
MYPHWPWTIPASSEGTSNRQSTLHSTIQEPLRLRGESKRALRGQGDARMLESLRYHYKRKRQEHRKDKDNKRDNKDADKKKDDPKKDDKKHDPKPVAPQLPPAKPVLVPPPASANAIPTPALTSPFPPPPPLLPPPASSVSPASTLATPDSAAPTLEPLSNLSQSTPTPMEQPPDSSSLGEIGRAVGITLGVLIAVLFVMGLVLRRRTGQHSPFSGTTKGQVGGRVSRGFLNSRGGKEEDEMHLRDDFPRIVSEYALRPPGVHTMDETSIVHAYAPAYGEEVKSANPSFIYTPPPEEGRGYRIEVPIPDTPLLFAAQQHHGSPQGVYPGGQQEQIVPSIEVQESTITMVGPTHHYESYIAAPADGMEYVGGEPGLSGGEQAGGEGPGGQEAGEHAGNEPYYQGFSSGVESYLAIEPAEGGDRRLSEAESVGGSTNPFRYTTADTEFELEIRHKSFTEEFEHELSAFSAPDGHPLTTQGAPKPQQ